MRSETWVAYVERADGTKDVVDVCESWEFPQEPCRLSGDREIVWSDLANLPKEAHLGAVALAKLLGICKKSVERAVRRDELPSPFKMGGKSVWMVGTILVHLQRRQDAALAKQATHAKKITMIR